MNEVEALARQAISDLDFYEKLEKDPGALDCQIVHFLQMAGEKAAKAVLYALNPHFRMDEAGNRKLSHVALSMLMPALSRRESLHQSLGLPAATVRAKLKAYRRLYAAIEELHPEMTQGRVNSEYPWERGGDWIAPCNHPFGILADLRAGDGPEAVYFIRQLARCAPSIARR
jgi:hypothetical protein